jgi:hypothetical protein
VSAKVVSAVMTHSEARLSARLVLLAIADNADEGSGIAWPPIVDHPDTPPHRLRSISFKTRLSEREVRLSLRQLEQLDELEVTQAQRGRSRINVYRVTVGYLREREPRLTDDVPFKLLRPFSTTGKECRQSAAGPQGLGLVRDSATRRATTGRVCRQSDAGPPAFHDVDHRHSGPLTTGTLNARAEKVEPSVEPSIQPGEEERVELGNAIRLALTAELGAKSFTRQARELWQDAVEQLVEVDATADEVRERCATYRRIFPEAALTPLALVRHWPLLGTTAIADSNSGDDDGAKLGAWVEKTGWRLDPQDARDMLADTGLAPDRLEWALARAAELRQQHDAGETATVRALDSARSAA